MVQQTRRSFMKISGAALGGLAVGTTVTAATSTDRFIVDAKKVKGSLGSLEVVHDLSNIDVLVVEGPESEVQATGADYAPDIEMDLNLPVDERPTAGEATDEPLFDLQWDKQAQDIPSAHEVTRGEGTRIAIVDTGVGAGHPDLAPVVNEDLSRDFTGDGFGAPGPWGGDHGSHVAGIAAASDTNDFGTVGTAPGTEVVDCRVFSFSELASFADILAALEYATSIGCDAVNMSLGSYPNPRQGMGSFYGKVLNKTVNFAKKEGTLLVASAGNDSADLQHDGGVISLPNEAAGAMSISATGPIGFAWGDPGLRQPPTTPAFYTNFGTNAINVSAPGGNADQSAIGTGVPWFRDLVLNTLSIPDPNNLGDTDAVTHTHGHVAGTSMSAPQVTGAAALVKSVNPNYNANKVRSTLERTARNVGDKSFHGAGFLDPNAAVRD